MVPIVTLLPGTVLPHPVNISNDMQDMIQIVLFMFFSVYVDKDYRRQGIGALMYAELEKRLKDLGIVNMLAGSAFCETEDEYLSHDSYEFHKRMGYEKVARMKGIGRKFDRWYDLLWLQKKL